MVSERDCLGLTGDRSKGKNSRGLGVSENEEGLAL